MSSGVQVHDDNGSVWVFSRSKCRLGLPLSKISSLARGTCEENARGELRGGRISEDEVSSRVQDFWEFNIVLGASADIPGGCNGVLNLRGSQPRVSRPAGPAVKNSRAPNLNCRCRLNL